MLLLKGVPMTEPVGNLPLKSLEFRHVIGAFRDKNTVIQPFRS
jgi:hypothetical protein